MCLRSLFTAGLVLLAGCAIPDDQEVALGRQHSEQINAQLPIVLDPEIHQYINRLGRDIAANTSRRDLDWHFYVVNDPQVNAFALPGGFIYVNRGLIDRADRLDELAGVIGHEVGHVVQRHSVKRLEKAQKTNVGVSIFCMITGFCDNALTQVAINVGGSAYFARHSRRDEAQADSEAVENVLNAGIDPSGIPEFFEKLIEERKHEPGVLDGWFADHPLEEARVSATRTMIKARLPGSSPRLREDSPDFQTFKARVSTLPRVRAAPPPQLESR